MTTEEVAAMIQAAFPDAEVHVDDFHGNSGDHFRAEITSAAFQGLSLVEQHRKVYAAVQAALGDGRIHALSLTTKAR